jgi:hypothetical protein
LPPLNLYARVRFLLCNLHTRPRVQRAPGLPCALCIMRGWNEMQSPGASRRENANLRLSPNRHAPPPDLAFGEPDDSGDTV